MNKQENDDVMALRNACELLCRDYKRLLTMVIIKCRNMTTDDVKSCVALLNQNEEAIKKVESYIT